MLIKERGRFDVDFFFTKHSIILLTLLYYRGLDKGISMRIKAEDITSQLIEEHGLQKAYQVALIRASESVKTGDNYLLSVMREVKAAIRSKIDE